MSSPLIRALAVRTMGYIRVKRINEYLIEPLKELLNDDDPYVKKTAVLCVPKVYEVTPDLIEKHGIISTLQKMIVKETNTLVVANLMSCFQEIAEMRYNIIQSYKTYLLIKRWKKNIATQPRPRAKAPSRYQ